jgi:hypothetical protein
MKMIKVKGIGIDTVVYEGIHLVPVPAGAEVDIPEVLVPAARALGLTFVDGDAGAEAEAPAKAPARAR